MQKSEVAKPTHIFAKIIITLVTIKEVVLAPVFRIVIGKYVFQCQVVDGLHVIVT